MNYYRRYTLKFDVMVLLNIFLVSNKLDFGVKSI